jgi:urease accessory protein
MMIRVRRSLLFLGLLLAAPLAHAHPGHVHAQGLIAGFLHPLTGVDHILFMLGAGLLVALRAPAQGVRLIALMLLAQALAAVAMVLPIEPRIWEVAIGVSLIAIGLLLWRREVSAVTRATAVLGAGLHAAAHWSGLPAGAPALSYGVGLALAGALLYGAGHVAGRALRPQADRVARVFGVSLTGGGLWWLLFG